MSTDSPGHFTAIKQRAADGHVAIKGHHSQDTYFHVDKGCEEVTLHQTPHIGNGFCLIVSFPASSEWHWKRATHPKKTNESRKSTWSSEAGGWCWSKWWYQCSLSEWSCKLLETPQKRDLEAPDDWSSPEEQVLSHLWNLALPSLRPSMQCLWTN